MTDPTYDITLDFSEPWFGGSSAPAIDDRSLPVSIAGRGFLLDLDSGDFSRRSVNLINTQQADSGKDAASISPEVWRRSSESWHQGAGQDRYDREDSLAARFKASVGIDPWTKYRLSLLPSSTALLSLGASAAIGLETIGKKLFVVLADKVSLYADPTVSSSHTDHAFASAPVASCADGQNLYVLDTAGVIHKYDSVAATWNDTWATVTAFSPTKAMLAYVKGFILVGNGPKLLDYTVPGTPVTIFTHRLADWWWRAASEGTTVVYVLGGIGDRWHVHRMGLDATATALDPPIVAASLPEGEFAYTISTYLGYVLIGVHNGWRFGIPDSSGSLTYGQVVRTPHAVRAFECQDRFVWFGLSIDSGDDADPEVIRNDIYSEHAGLGRADLSTFVAPLTPAAASDLYAEALFGSCVDVATVGGEDDGIGRRVYAISGPSASGVYLEGTDLLPEGWLRQGHATFNSTDPKMGLYAQVFHEPLVGSIDVSVDIDSEESFVLIGSNNNDDTTSAGNMAFTVPFASIELKYTLHRGAVATAGPALKRAEVRAINVPGRATEWRIPIFVKELENYANVVTSHTVREDYEFLVSLVQTREQFTYREGDRTWLLHAVDFLWTPDRMTSDSTTYQGTFTLIAREIT
jgi:hypothetical protein